MSGNLFKKDEIPAEPISSEVAPYVQKCIIDELLEVYPDLEVLPIGSVGKKPDGEFNGDIDIAVKADTIEDLLKIIHKVFDYTETVDSKTLKIVSIKYPYQLDDGTIHYVAVDFMQMRNRDYTAFRYYCPDYRKNESYYKVGTKIMFVGTILNYCQKPYLEGYTAKYIFDSTHLWCEQYNEETKEVIEQFITIDPQEVVDIMFKDSGLEVCNSVETLWDAIHSDKFRYPENVKAIELAFFINSYRKGWEEMVNPADFKCQYWTLEEIVEHLIPHTMLRNINIKLSNLKK